MSGNEIQVRLQHGETVIEVDGWPSRDAPYYVVSSNLAANPNLADFPGRTLQSIRQRERDGGQSKGRVLYAFRSRALFQEDVPVAALLYHIEDRVFRVTNLGVATYLAGAERDRMKIILLECAQLLAGRIEAPSLEWLVYSEADAREAQRLFEFARVRRRNKRMKQFHGNEILLERA